MLAKVEGFWLLLLYALFTLFGPVELLVASAAPCVTAAINSSYAILLPRCTDIVSDRVNVLASIGVMKKRVPVANFSEPFVEIGFVFQDITPVYVISTPVFIGEGHISDMIEGILHKTTGIWAWDIIIDSSPDRSKEIIIDAIANFSLSRSRADSCRAWCSRTAGSHRGDTCRQHSFPTFIRIITAPWPLWETKADNTVFSDRLYAQAKYAISVQADQLVLERAWNVFLSIPAAVWPDVISVSTSCAENLQCVSDGRRPMYGQIGSACNQQGLHKLHVDSSTMHRTGLGGPAAEVFHIRDSSTRGPLLFHMSSLRELGFYDERNYILGNDDHDLHLRAFEERRYVTGFYPVLWRNIKRNRTAEFMLKRAYLGSNRLARVRKERVMGAYLSSREGGREGRPLLFNRSMSAADTCLLAARDGGEGLRVVEVDSSDGGGGGHSRKRFVFKQLIQAALNKCGEELSRIVGESVCPSCSDRDIL
jgi:hypothetical protein